MKINEFSPTEVCPILAGDTETHTFVDGVLLSEEEIKELFAEQDDNGNYIHGATWAREHVTVQAYAWLLSDGRKWAYLETFDEFVDFCVQHQTHSVWWYNAKFDFAFFDYEMLTNGWQGVRLAKKQKLKDKQFASLHGPQGQRYKLTLAVEAHIKAKKDRHKHVYSFSNYDLCNIFGGGLAANLASFNVCDYDGNPIRKLTMDYQGDENLDYMKNDVYGLFHLLRLSSEYLEKNHGYSLMEENCKIMTAGGLAKRLLLRELYHDKDKVNVSKFQSDHQIDIETDTYVRSRYLYQGGKTIANPLYLNKLLYNGYFYDGEKKIKLKGDKSKIYYYDVNSMYPAQMRVMPDLIGQLLSINPDREKEYREMGYQIIYEIEIPENGAWLKRAGALGVLYNPVTREYVDEMTRASTGAKPLMFFDFEIEMLEKFYFLDFQIIKIWAIAKTINYGYKRYVDRFYKEKAEAKKAHDGVRQAFAKLALNSSYGKLSEKATKEVSHREISVKTGCVILVDDGEETEEKALLNVIQGAYITAKARCMLMQYMIDICGGACNTAENIVYCDTDSIQTFLPYDKADDFALGALKLETGRPYVGGKWLAPKTYVLIGDDGIDGYIRDASIRPLAVHTKGVNVKVFDNLFNKQGKETYETSPADIDKFFRPGVKYQTLCGINVIGGKALLPLEKELCRFDNILATNYECLYDEHEKI